MPDSAIAAYYDAIAPKILPFLRGRPVAVRHAFGAEKVFRRRAPGGRWIRLASRRDLQAVVHQHGYEFFPHLEGEKDVWFALDVDVRAVPLQLGKVVVRTLLDILEERRIQYLLTFSGGNGFHLRWAFRKKGLPRRRWAFLRRIVRDLRAEAETRLQASPHRDAFYAHIPSGDPITELSAADRVAQHSVLLDELILKRNATIRAPFSLHLAHRWVAVPLEPRRLEAFVPATDATMHRALAVPAARLPANSLKLFRRPTWVAL